MDANSLLDSLIKSVPATERAAVKRTLFRVMPRRAQETLGLAKQHAESVLGGLWDDIAAAEGTK